MPEIAVPLLESVDIDRDGVAIVFPDRSRMAPGRGRYWVAANGVLLFDDGRRGALYASEERRRQLHSPNLRWSAA